MLNPMRIFPLTTNHSVTLYDKFMFNIQIFEHSPNCKTNTAMDQPIKKQSFATKINYSNSLGRS